MLGLGPCVLRSISPDICFQSKLQSQPFPLQEPAVIALTSPIGPPTPPWQEPRSQAAVSGYLFLPPTSAPGSSPEGPARGLPSATLCLGAGVQDLRLGERMLPFHLRCSIVKTAGLGGEERRVLRGRDGLFSLLYSSTSDFRVPGTF